MILKDMREGNTDMKVIEQKDKSTKVGKVLHRYILSTVLIVYAGYQINSKENIDVYLTKQGFLFSRLSSMQQ